MSKGVLAALAAIVVAVLAAAPAQGGPGFFFGFTEDAPKWHGAEAVAPARDLGASAFRITLTWSPGQTGLSSYDAAVLDRAIVGNPLRVVLAVYGATGSSAPQDAGARDQFCTYVRSALQRFPTVNDVVIWNEPNKPLFWNPQFAGDGSPAPPAPYGALAAPCWDVLHSYRPSVNLIGPALSSNGNDVAPGGSISPGAFIRALGDWYRASGRTQPLFDTIGHHPYGLTPGERPWRKHIGSKVIAQGDWNKLMYNLWLAFHGTAQPIPGEGSTQLWYMEAGYQTRVTDAKAAAYTGTENVAVIADDAGGEPDSPAPAETSTAPDQRTQILDGVRLAYCQPFVGSFFNFLMWDESGLAGWQSGAFWADRTPKASHAAFRQVIAETNARTTACSTLKGGQPSADFFPPSAPGTPSAQLLEAPLRVALSWAAATDNVGATTYRVYRNGAHIATTSSLTWTQAVADSSTFTYTLRALDAAENMGDASGAVTVTTPDRTAPSVPTGVAGRSFAAPTRVELSWSASTDAGGVTGYDVYRDGVVVATTAVPAYTDTAVATSAGHTYVVVARDAAGNASAPSASAAVTTVPAAPTDLVGTSPASGAVTLDWADGAGVHGYHVYRATSAAGPFERRTASLVTASAVSDTGVAGMTYHYVVTATNGGGESAPSASVSVTLRAPATKAYVPSAATILAGTVYAGRGAVSLLHYDDASRYELSSSGKAAQFYASATIAEPKPSLQSLRVEYDGNASYGNVSVTLSVFNWRTGAWQAVDGPRTTVTTADRQFAWTAPGVSDYVSSTGAVRFRVDATRNNSFLLRTDLIRFTVTY